MQSIQWKLSNTAEPSPIIWYVLSPCSIYLHAVICFATSQQPYGNIWASAMVSAGGAASLPLAFVSIGGGNKLCSHGSQKRRGTTDETKDKRPCTAPQHSMGLMIGWICLWPVQGPMILISKSATWLLPCDDMKYNQSKCWNHCLLMCCTCRWHLFLTSKEGWSNAQNWIGLHLHGFRRQESFVDFAWLYRDKSVSFFPVSCGYVCMKNINMMYYFWTLSKVCLFSYIRS